jgi:hypothetical protein
MTYLTNAGWVLFPSSSESHQKRFRLRLSIPVGKRTPSGDRVAARFTRGLLYLSVRKRLIMVQSMLTAPPCDGSTVPLSFTASHGWPRVSLCAARYHDFLFFVQQSASQTTALRSTQLLSSNERHDLCFSVLFQLNV